MKDIYSAIDPIAIKIGPLAIHWYGVIIAAGIFIAILLSSREAEKRGIQEDTVIDMAIWMIPLAFIGARLYYVLFKLDYYIANPAKIIAIWEGGIAIYGGLIAGGLVVYWFSKQRGVPIWLMLDVIAPSVLLAQAIGRWGNFINQEAHGGPVTRAFLENLHLPEFIINQMEINGVYYHPTFLYESLWSLAGFVVILLLRNKEHLLLQGEVALSYVIWYSTGRLWIEGMRTDSLYIPGTPVRVSQLLSGILLIGAVIVWVHRRRDFPKKPYYTDGLTKKKRKRKKAA